MLLRNLKAHMIQQFHSWVWIQRKWGVGKKGPPCSSPSMVWVGFFPMQRLTSLVRWRLGGWKAGGWALRRVSGLLHRSAKVGDNSRTGLLQTSSGVSTFRCFHLTVDLCLGQRRPSSKATWLGFPVFRNVTDTSNKPHFFMDTQCLEVEQEH